MSGYWTAERILAAISAWGSSHGGIAPTSTAWRKATPHTPSAQTVVDRFGSWNLGLAIAGYPTRKTGPRPLVGATT